MNAARAEAKATGVRVERWDSEVAGLHVRVTPRGTGTFFVRYRSSAGRRRLKLGPVSIGVEKARKLAGEAIGDVSDGKDPQAARKAERTALRMVDLFGETDPEDKKKDTKAGWYLGTYVRTAGRLGTAKAAASIASDRYRIRKHLRSRTALMHKLVAAVTVADVERIKAEVMPGTWRQLRDILRVGFAHAEQIGVIPVGSNPAARVKANAARKVERYLSPAERKRLDDALASAEKIGPHGEGGLTRGYVRAFRILLLTGMRLGEVLALRWEQIDWRHEQLRLPTSKTGGKSVPLSPQAVAYLRAQKGTVERVGLVCPDRNGKPFAANNAQRAWRAVRATAKIHGVRVHDLRHSWASDAASAGVPLAIIGAVLGHRSPTTTQRYAHLHNVAIRDGLAKAGDAIERATANGR